jgi:hypothetical protein
LRDAVKSEWKTPDQYKAETGKAYKAAVFFGNDADAMITAMIRGSFAAWPRSAQKWARTRR